MTQVNSNPLAQMDATKLLVLSSVFITLFIAFIDEGNYNFNWVYDLGSWVALLIYTSVIFFIQFLVFKIFLKKYQMIGKIISGVLIVTIIVLMITFGVSYN